MNKRALMPAYFFSRLLLFIKFHKAMNPGLIVERSVQIPAGKCRNTFLDYYKIILEKVSFDPQLFKKEYKKAIDVLSQSERTALNGWIKAMQFRHYASEGTHAAARSNQTMLRS